MLDGNDTTSNRSKQIYNAVKSVGSAAYYIATGKENEENSTQIILPVDVKHELLPFVYLPIFQLLANRITTDLHRWEKHPMFKHFRENIKSKMK